MADRKPRCTCKDWCSYKSRKHDNGSHKPQCLAVRPQDYGECQWRVIPKKGEWV